MIGSLYNIALFIPYIFLIGAFLGALIWRSLPSSEIVFTKLLLLSITVVCGLSVGMWRYAIVADQLQETVLNNVTNQTVTIIGTVIREPDRRLASSLVTVETSDTRVLVRTDRNARVAYGDVIEVTGKLETPEDFITEYNRIFPYEGYLLARGVTHTMSFVDLVIIENGSPFTIPRFLSTFKTYFLSRLSLVLPEPAYGLGVGMLLGINGSLGEHLDKVFRTTGLSHIVVLSGYNIMLVVAFTLFVLGFVLPWRWRLWLAGVMVIVFVVMVGYSPSVVRAAIMAIIFLLLTSIGRPYDVVRALVIAAGVMVFMNPYILRYDIGFQLSCMATLGLLMITPQLEIAFTKLSVWLSVRTFLASTVAAQVAVLPLVLYHIGQWSLVALPANVLVVPLVPLAMLGTMVTGVVSLLSVSLAIPLAMITTLILNTMIMIASWLASWPFAAVIVPSFPAVLLILMYGGLGYLWYWWQQQSTQIINHSSDNDIHGWTVETEVMVQSRQLLVKNATTTSIDVVVAESDSPEPIFFR